MNYLYERKKELEKQLNEMLPRCFQKDVKIFIQDLRARLYEINRAIKAIEHEL